MARTRKLLSPRAPHAASRRFNTIRDRLERLEDRTVPAFTNVLVNNPAADLGSNDTQSETTLVLAGSNVVVAFNDSGSNAGNTKFTGFAQSTNGGATFTDKGTLPTSTSGDAGDPALARDNVSGTIYLATLGYSSSNVIQVFRSTDGGATFGAPVNAASGFSSGHSLDKEWIAVDNAPGVGQGTVYVVFTDFGSIFGPDNGVFLTRSTNGGATWSSPLSLGGSQGGYVTVGPDHTVYVFDFVAGTPQKIQMRKSTNQGVSFGAAVTVANLTATGSNGDLGLTVSSGSGTAVRTNAFPQAAVTPNGMYVSFNDKGPTGDKADVFFVKSTDGGATWSAKVKLNDDATTRDQWQPALAVTPDGNSVGVFWYDRRLDAANALIDRYGVIGTVSGSAVTFGSNFRITDQSFPAVVGQDSLINGTYMGDYDVAVADNGGFYITWGDNRLADSAHAHQPDVRFAKIPLAGTTHFSVTATPSTTTAGAPFSLTVTALDANNNLDPTYRGTVHLTSTDGGAGVVLPGDYTFTDLDAGTHSFTNGATLVTAGNQTVTVADKASSSVNGSATETVTAAAATHFTIGAPASATAGTAFTMTVTAQDQYNNTATSYTGSVQFTSSDGAATLPHDPMTPVPADYTFTAAESGTHTFTNGVTLNTVGSQTITATDTATAITGTATVNVSVLIQATQFAVTPPVTTTTAGSTFSITVTAQDASGNAADSYRGTVHFTSTDTRTGVVLPGDYTFTAADNGVHTFTGVRLVTAGPQSVTATDSVSTTITGGAAVTVNPAAATHLVVGAPSSVRVNVAFTITVTAVDNFGNTATGYRGTVRFTSSLKQTKLPSAYSFTTADGGVHTFTNDVAFTRIGNATLTASDRNNGSVTGSTAIAVTTGPMAGPGASVDSDEGLDELLGEVFDDRPPPDNARGLAVGAVLQQLKDEGILATFFAANGTRSRHDLIALLRNEIEDFLASDVGFGDFNWV
jgi:hypothetical protein